VRLASWPMCIIICQDHLTNFRQDTHRIWKQRIVAKGDEYGEAGCSARRVD
jgi:hypothetical protein